MFHLWSLAEQDLLSENVPYRLRDTGQGLNRVQPAPKTSRMMHNILHKAQTSVGTWIGSSVIHMGDHNVPNALMFIDKYTQIYRILLPICNTLQQIPHLTEKPALKSYIEDEFGTVDNLIREILGDFFRHGFDGSGADNFFDAGSCIDGRLTSAWNWCSSLEKKRYFHVFLLTGTFVVCQLEATITDAFFEQGSWVSMESGSHPMPIPLVMRHTFNIFWASRKLDSISCLYRPPV
jgi:hypothetical protein